MRFPPLRGDYSIHPSTCHTNEISPNQRWLRDSSTDGISPTRRIVFVNSVDGISSTQKVSMQTCLRVFLGHPMRAETSVMGFFPLRGSCMCTPLMGFPAHESVNTDLPRRFSRSSYESQNPMLWDFPHLESSTLLQGFLLSDPPSNVSLMGLLYSECKH